MGKHLPSHKKFEAGDIIHFTYPALMSKGFGRRIYPASIKTKSLAEQRYLANNLEEGHPGALDMALSDPPDEGHGMVLMACFEQDQGSEGFWYYKVLLGEKLFWVAVEHLSLAKDE